MKLNDEIIKIIENNTGSTIISVSSLSGGCISEAYKVILNDGSSCFLKFNSRSPKDTFVKEAHGLTELKKADAIRIPEVFFFDSFLILTEFIETGLKHDLFFENFGRELAQMHEFTNESYGFYEDNYIGSNPQINIPEGSEKDDWAQFYFNKRLLFQFKLAEAKGYATDELRKSFRLLENKIDTILKGSKEKPSLLHGDLWSGNFMVDKNGNACLIDPAVYYGHREADLGMTKLFGGFNNRFYKAYTEYSPLPDGYEYREDIYMLYHVLNHLNIFGSGYYPQAISLIKKYI